MSELTSIITIIYMVLALIFSKELVRIMGVYGVYFGSLAIDSIIVLWTVILVKKEFTVLRKSYKEGALSA